MKKITLLCFMILTSYGLVAQQTISFETSESYNLGDINGQNGWVTTGTGPGTFVTNQIISDEQSTDGTQSFKITTESAFGGQDSPIIGGFYDYPTAVPYDGTVISYDIYIEQVADGNDYRFGLTGVDGLNDNGDPALFFIAFIDFNFQNNIRVVNNDNEFENVGTWASNTWYNVKIELSTNQAEYFIDGVSVATFNLLREIDITGARFINDNWGGSAYFDNFRTNDEPLSTFDFNTSKIDYFVDAQNYLNLSANEQIESVTLHNLLGQNVLSQKLSNQEERIDLNALSKGVYLVQAQINNISKTFRIVKK